MVHSGPAQCCLSGYLVNNSQLILNAQVWDALTPGIGMAVSREGLRGWE